MSDLWNSPTVVPSVVYKDGPAAVEWLETAYGFIEREGSRLVGDTWTLTWVEVGEDGLLHLTTGGHGLTTPNESGYASQSLKVYVPDIDSHFESAKTAGAEIIFTLQDMFRGGRIYRAKDPEGHVWELSQVDIELPVEQWKLPGNSTRRWVMQSYGFSLWRNTSVEVWS